MSTKTNQNPLSTQPKVNRQFKDHVFIDLFGSPDRKEFALSLYNAVNGTSYTNPEELELYTIEEALYMSMRNDVSFIFDSVLSLYEHQSTVNLNMPLRGLFYFAKQYEKYLYQKDESYLSRRRVMIPTPQYTVFYNGEEKWAQDVTLKLSDSFTNKRLKGSVEVWCDVININYKERHEVVQRVRDNIDRGMTREEAVDLALDECTKEKHLGQYFTERRAEVKDMILEEYDEAKIQRIIARDAREEGLAEGEAKGKAEGLVEGEAKGKAEGLVEGVAKGKAEGLAEGLAMADAKDRKRFQKLAAAGMDISTIADRMDISTIADLMEVSEETVRKAVQKVCPEE